MDDSTQDEESWGWQATATSMKDRTTYLWKNNPIPFNVTFDVGPKGQKERIGAHRDILAISSKVFYSMFYGPLARPKESNEPVVDDNIDPEAFNLMLKFMYTETIAGRGESEDTDESENSDAAENGDASENSNKSVKSDQRIEPFPTGVELGFKTMHAAVKYGIRALYLFCRNYILNDIQKKFSTSESVAECGLLYALYARNPGWTNERIIAAVWREIDAFTEAVLKVSDQVLRVVDVGLMVDFLSRSSLNVSKEIMLYNFALRWARLQQEGPRKGETLKIVMEKVCEVLRFSSLSEQEWLDGPVKDGIYDEKDLKYKAALADGTSRYFCDAPAVITLAIYELEESKKRVASKAPNAYKLVYDEVDNLGTIEIQTQTEDNPVLTQLVEKCVCEQSDRGMCDPSELTINFKYMGRELVRGTEGYADIQPNEEELKLLTDSGQTAAEMKLGLGDVAVGFGIDLDDKEDTIRNIYLFFGDGSGNQYTYEKHWEEATAPKRLFYLGRLTAGQDCLDRMARSPRENKRYISYDVDYKKKTLDGPARKKRKTRYTSSMF